MDQAQIAKELEAAKAKATELEAQNKALKEKLQAEKQEPNTIKGSFTAEWKTPMGKDVTRKFGFVKGHSKVWINNSKSKDNVLISSEALIALANGKKVTDEFKEAHPWLTQELAAAHLTHLAKVGYGYLEDRK